MRLRKQKRLRRGAGVLLPVASLPSPYGIGSFGRDARNFVDFLADAGQRYWQVLPLCPTSYGDSPYQSFSAFAGNPYFIDLDTLIQEGLLEEQEVTDIVWGTDPCQVDYACIFKERYALLGLAFARSWHRGTDTYKRFVEENSFWLEDYSFYMAIKAGLGWKSWQKWPENLRLREEETLRNAAEDLATEIDFWKFCQFKFFEQWDALKAYANEKGIEIIGDIPIYVAMDSADVWARGDLFQLDTNRNPTAVAGVPPDLFSETGQLWGNPLYNWERIEAEDFRWWKERMCHSARLYDIVRIDHFIGVVNYYAIPAGEDTALNGTWVDGPGAKLIAAIQSAMGDSKIIAEDLGVVTKRVTKLREQAGFPGMKLMKFGFADGPKSDFLPCHYEKNTVIYAGTHDNETLVGYLGHQSRKTLRYARDYLGVKRNGELPWAIIRAGYASAADTAIFQMQDLLGLDNSARTNYPSTIGGNWQWRLERKQLSSKLAKTLHQMAIVYDRIDPADEGEVAASEDANTEEEN